MHRLGTSPFLCCFLYALNYKEGPIFLCSHSFYCPPVGGRSFSLRKRAVRQTGISPLRYPSPPVSSNMVKDFAERCWLAVYGLRFSASWLSGTAWRSDKQRSAVAECLWHYTRSGHAAGSPPSCRASPSPVVTCPGGKGDAAAAAFVTPWIKTDVDTDKNVVMLKATALGTTRNGKKKKKTCLIFFQALGRIS